MCDLMNWITHLNEALGYIEEHLDDAIDYERVARIACCSSFHFQRMFSYMSDITLGEYIRRRRMSRAAFDLLNSDDRIIDIALKYGYDSPTSFNRAFQSIHGMAPSAARLDGAELKTYPPISFRISIQGRAEMNYRIEKHEPFRVVGLKKEITWTPENQEGFLEVPKFWAEPATGPAIMQLCSIMDIQPQGVLGMSVGNWHQNGTFDYYIGVASSQPMPGGMAEYVVPAGTWAIFDCVGAMPQSMQAMQQRIMTEWFPNSGYQYADAPDIEVYGPGDQSAEDYLCWIWVPVEAQKTTGA